MGVRGISGPMESLHALFSFVDRWLRFRQLLRCQRYACIVIHVQHFCCSSWAGCPRGSMDVLRPVLSERIDRAYELVCVHGNRSQEHMSILCACLAWAGCPFC